MRVIKSKTASGPESLSGWFAALHQVTGQRSDGDSAMPMTERTERPETGVIVDAAVAGVAEGAGLAHDAGNLLGALSLYSELLDLPGVLHDEYKGYASELRMLSERSWAMIDRLVNHARAGRSVKAQGETAVLPDVVDRCLGLLSRLAGRPVETSYGLGAFEAVQVPVESIERILANLVKNGAEATPWTGGPITIHVEGVLEEREAEGEGLRRRVVMTVSDRGCGMDHGEVQRLMQGAGGASRHGRGLGFQVVRELVAMSNGCLRVESRPGAGTSISAEWSAVKQQEEMVQQERLEGNVSRGRTLIRGEAGWMAC